MDGMVAKGTAIMEEDGLGMNDQVGGNGSGVDQEGGNGSGLDPNDSPMEKEENMDTKLEGEGKETSSGVVDDKKMEELRKRKREARKERRLLKRRAFIKYRAERCKERLKEKKKELNALRKLHRAGKLDEKQSKELEALERKKKEKYILLDRWKVPLEEALQLLSPPRIVVDLHWQEKLSEKQLKSLSTQLQQLYGFHKRHPRPLQLYLTSFGEPLESRMKKIGVDQWKFPIERRSYQEVFSRKEIVYLSPDAEEVLMDINENDVYIIGGIVDHNQMTNASVSHASEANVRCARLPINEANVLPKGVLFPSKSLNVNTVYQILCTFAATKDWSKALIPFLPQRKGYQCVPKSTPQSIESAKNKEEKHDDHHDDNLDQASTAV